MCVSKKHCSVANSGGLFVSPAAPRSVSFQQEEDFPRGMTDDLTPMERRALKTQAQRDVLFAEVVF